VRVLIDYRAALRDRTGVGEYTHQLVTALAQRFDRAELDLSVFSSSWKDRLTLTDRALDGVTAIDRRVPVRVLNFTWHRLGWPPAERLAGGRFDATHSLSPLILPAHSAAHLVTIHDLNFLTYPEQTRAEIRRDYPRLAAAHARRAQRIVVPSQFTGREVNRRLDVPLAKIAVCPPGAPPWTARTHMADGGYVLFLGTLEPRKNVGTLLDAYERLAARRPQLPELVIAGQATEQSGPWLDRLRRAPLKRIARHVGYVDPRRRRELYEGARLLVQPSFEEGFGLPVLEAMTIGVPVVAADRGALPEVLGDAGPLVNAEDADQFAAAIEHLLDDEAYAAVCASKGAARARHFTWSATAERVYEAYREAMHERACASA
jgi:glycosyltransferase involved in cell wall biosynthesis